MPYAGPIASQTRLIPKLILYKIKRTSPFDKFNLLLATETAWKYTSRGPDPADLDISSAQVSANFSSLKWARLPYDSWIPRDIGLTGDVNAGTIKAATLTGPQDAYFQMEDLDAKLMKLSWKNVAGGTYATDFPAFVKLRKKFILDSLKGKDSISEDLVTHDLTDFLVKYTHRTTLEDFGNNLTVLMATDPQATNSAGAVVAPMSAANYASQVLAEALGGAVVQEFTNGKTGSVSTVPLIEENDVVELRIKYVADTAAPPRLTESAFIDSEGFERVYIGFVTSLTRDFKYGASEVVSMECHGISKIFSLYSTQFVPSLASSSNFNFEEGVDIADLRFSVFSNQFNSMSAADIFRYFMKYGLFSMSASDLDQLEAETLLEVKKVEQALADLSYPQIPSRSVDFFSLSNTRTASEVEAAALLKRKAELEEFVAQVKKRQLQSDFRPKFEVKNLPGDIGPGDTLDLDLYYTNAKYFTNVPSFQTMHLLPLLLDAAKENAITELTAPSADKKFTPQLPARTTAAASLSRVIASAEQGFNIAYRLMVASAFRMFYPELKTPHTIFSEIRETTYLEIFEDRPGVIRMRPPKYNIMNLNLAVSEFPEIDTSVKHVFKLSTPTGTVDVNGGYVLNPTDIVAVSLSRDDAAIFTRADTSWQLPLAGEVLPEYTGAFEDASYLMRYGLRPAGVQSNPMAIDPTTAKFMSALALAVKNKGARTASITVMNDREYQVGRLYYVPVSTPVGDQFDGVVSRGIVGYITGITTAYDYGGEPTHELTLEYLRQAEIVEIKQEKGKIYYANFKKLPDLSTLIRKMSTAGELNNAVAAATSPKGTNPRRRGSHSTSDCGGFLVLENGMTTRDTARRDNSLQASYAQDLDGTGVLQMSQVTDSDATTIQNEKNRFCTHFASKSFRDVATNALLIKSTFLGKLALYEYDPYCAFYPSISLPKWTLPYVLSTRNRNTYDLMCFIATAARKYANYLLDLGDVAPTDIPAYALLGGTITIDQRPNLFIQVTQNLASVGGGNVNDEFSKHTLRCFISVQRGALLIRKVLVFGVPVFKSVLLSNLVNEGVVEGGGFRSPITAAQVTGETKTAATDMHTDGSAVVFGDLEASLWSVSDIINFCSELSFVKDSVADKGGVAEELAQLRSMQQNAVVEPRYESDQALGRPSAAIYSGQNLAGEWDAKAAVSSLLGDAADDRYLAYPNLGPIPTDKLSFRDWLANKQLKQYVLVPIADSFFATYVGNLAKHVLTLPASKGTATAPLSPGLTNYKTVDVAESRQVPGMLVLGANKLATVGGAVKFPATAAEGLFVDNRTNSNPGLSFFEASDPRYAAVADIKFDISAVDKLQLLTPRKDLSLRKYIGGQYAASSPMLGNPHYIMLADSLYFKLAQVDTFNKSALADMQAHPLAYVWHSSYASPVSKSFQVDKYHFAAKAAKGTISMPPIQDPV